MACCVFFLGLLAVLLLELTEGAEKVYSAEGGKVTLEPIVPDQFKPLTSILWKHNRNMVVEWIKNLNSTDYYGMFDGHTNLDIETGHLEISTWAHTYSGFYSVEFNGQLQSKLYTVHVIKKVPKPTVGVRPLSCSSTSSSCTLSCEGGTPEAEPITYSWRRDEGKWTQSSKLMNITKDDHHVKKFSCQMKNPVSVEESDPRKNPFYPEKVLKPTVVLNCSHTPSVCTLLCNGGTPEAEPITYSWRRDGGKWSQSSKLIEITEADHHYEHIFCQMKNPVSVEESDPWKNPFYPDPPVRPIVGGVLAAVVVAVGAAAVVGFLKRDAIKQKISNRNGSPRGGDPARSSGVTPHEEQPIMSSDKMTGSPSEVLTKL
ncbi:carcinoembryonic antigen-related cell adhesion molecule 2-like isoform X2 [Myripristis murdjan]|uniref:carcinoembryonic antigen-related cell adhesion molecule 2-like isoform X2 n=1 Tax=Myripristis murdjan TaxID=586833 RepID=UPI00117615A8|nr:carcinoembryonic antigen-related cell adhesion molecule 2-like isoform X2 [Myripristis murdjan]